MRVIEPTKKFKRGWRQVLGEKDHGLFESTTGMIVVANIKYDTEGNAIEINYNCLNGDNDLNLNDNGVGFGGNDK